MSALNFTRLLANKCQIGVKYFSIGQKRLESYKAAIFKEKGKPLVVEEIPILKLKKNQVRVQVHYCSVNSTDYEILKHTKEDLPFIPGYELSGEIIEVGSDIKPVDAIAGDRVAVLSKRKGGFAEQIVVDPCDVWRISSKVDLKSAAVLPYAHTNALYAFSKLVAVNEKSLIVVCAGSGGKGLAAIDVAANVFKAKPYCVCHTEDEGQLVRERGAFKTAPFKSKDLRKSLGIKEGADIVYDAVGGEIHEKVNKCVKPHGNIFYASLIHSATIPTPPANSYLTAVDIEELRKFNPKLFRTLVQDTLDLADQSIISAYISAKYELNNINDAVKFIEDKKCTGKVCIKVSNV